MRKASCSPRELRPVGALSTHAAIAVRFMTRSGIAPHCCSGRQVLIARPAQFCCSPRYKDQLAEPQPPGCRRAVRFSWYCFALPPHPNALNLTFSPRRGAWSALATGEGAAALWASRPCVAVGKLERVLKQRQIAPIVGVSVASVSNSGRIILDAANLRAFATERIHWAA